MGKKHREKRRNCLLQAISHFLTMFGTALYLQCVKMWHCVVMGLVPIRCIGTLDSIVLAHQYALFPLLHTHTVGGTCIDTYIQ